MTVIRNADLSYSTVRYPALDTLLAAVAVYQGGHVYELTSQEVTDLTAAGYGDFITTE